jgi:hypothetical protein
MYPVNGTVEKTDTQAFMHMLSIQQFFARKKIAFWRDAIATELNAHANMSRREQSR